MLEYLYETYTVGNVALVFALAVHIVGILIALLVDSYMDKNHKRALIAIFTLIASLIVQNIWEDALAAQEAYSPLRVYVAAYGYIVRPLILILFIHIVEFKKHYIAIAIIAFNTFVYATTPFTKLAFTISDDNHYLGGPLRYFCLISSISLMAYLVIISFKNYKVRSFKDLPLPLFNVSIIVIGTLLDGTVGGLRQSVTFLTISMVIASALYYRWLHMQFVQQHENDFAAEQRIQIMMTQIQPHFLYNTLSTIQALCMTNPQQAYEITGMFGKYLRKNIDSLEQPELIPLNDEIQHAKVYSDIEKVRFPDIEVEYIIEDGDFNLPALTVQPLVENAIRHGIRNVENGKVTVTAKKAPGAHIITVTDNGKGFDVDSAKKSGTHIGMKNVMERLEKMCNGTMKVNSVIDRGTTVTIRIPD